MNNATAVEVARTVNRGSPKVIDGGTRAETIRQSSIVSGSSWVDGLRDVLGPERS